MRAIGEARYANLLSRTRLIALVCCVLVGGEPIRRVYWRQGRIQADAWKPGLQRDFFKYGISPGLSEKNL